MSDLWEPEQSLHLRLHARPELMRILRHQLRGWLKEAGATDVELFEIQLAAIEAFSNAVKHPEERTSDVVEIEGTATNGTVTLSVRNHGRWRWQGESSTKEDGGLGLALMDALMDSVVIEPFKDGTTVTMHRHLARR